MVHTRYDMKKHNILIWKSFNFTNLLIEHYFLLPIMGQNYHFVRSHGLSVFEIFLRNEEKVTWSVKCLMTFYTAPLYYTVYSVKGANWEYHHCFLRCKQWLSHLDSVLQWITNYKWYFSLICKVNLGQTFHHMPSMHVSNWIFFLSVPLKPPSEAIYSECDIG